MSMRIFKYRLDITDKQSLILPVGARVLTAQFQSNETLRLWAMVNDQPFADQQVRTFNIYGTGNPMPDQPGNYIATVQEDGLVWHIFEEQLRDTST